MDAPTKRKASPSKKRRAERRKSGQASTGPHTPDEQFQIDLAAGKVQRHHYEQRRYKTTRRCCSSRWADDHWYGELHHGVARSWHTPVEYPPGGRETKMRRCERCGQDVPPQCFVTHLWHRLCSDCAAGGASGKNRLGVEGRAKERLYTELKQQGLTDKEIAAKAWHFEGHSQEQVGKYMGVSRQRVAQLLTSANRKLASHGLRADQVASEPARQRATDPARLDRYSSRNF